MYSVTMNRGNVEEKKALNFLEQMQSNLSHIDKDKYIEMIENLSLDNISGSESVSQALSIETISLLTGLLSSKQILYEDSKKTVRKKKSRRL